MKPKDKPRGGYSTMPISTGGGKATKPRGGRIAGPLEQPTRRLGEGRPIAGTFEKPTKRYEFKKAKPPASTPKVATAKPHRQVAAKPVAQYKDRTVRKAYSPAAEGGIGKPLVAGKGRRSPASLEGRDTGGYKNGRPRAYGPKMTAAMEGSDVIGRRRPKKPTRGVKRIGPPAHKAY